MNTNRTLAAAAITVVLVASSQPTWGRGFGGFHGGGGGFGGARAGGGFGEGGFGGAGGFGGGRGGALSGSGLGGGLDGIGGRGLGGGGIGEGLGAGGFGGLGGGALGGGLGAGGLGDRGLGGGLGAGGLGSGVDRGLGGGELGGALGDRGLGGFGGSGGGLGGQGFDGGRFGAGGLGNYAAPSRSQLGSFLGLPSDEGFHGLSNTGAGFDASADGFNVQHGSVEGPRGGYAGGTVVQGPAGGTYARGAAVGPEGGVAAGRAAEGPGGFSAAQGAAVGPEGGMAAGGVVQGPAGGTYARGAAVGREGGVAAGRVAVGPAGNAAAQGFVAGPGGRVAGGSAVRGPYGGAARGFVAGPNGAAAGFARVTPTARYTTAAAVRTNFNGYGMYRPGWYTAHPGAWYAAGWATGSAWRAATWASLGDWFGATAAPVYYDYGNNIVYQDDDVYVNGQDTGSASQYYSDATALADTGAQAPASPDEDWLPLGVFALSQNDQQQPHLSVQLAVNKQGVIRGNYADSLTNQTVPVEGAVDRTTQRADWTAGTDTTTVFETGLYNLTKDEAPLLVLTGDGSSQQWLMVRLKNPDGAASQSTQ